MKLVLRFALCCSLAAGIGIAQRLGGGGGFRGGGGGGFRGGFGGGAFRGGFGGGAFRGFGGGGFRGGFGRSFGFRGFHRPFLYSGFGFGFNYWPSYYDYGYYSPYPASYSYPVYEPNVTVVYAPPAPAPSTVYVERSSPSAREYDQYGQPLDRPSSTTASASPIYLIAFRDRTIRAAASYWAEAGTLHYVTLDREHKQAPLDTVDRDLSAQLNRERRVAFSLPSTQ